MTKSLVYPKGFMPRTGYGGKLTRSRQTWKEEVVEELQRRGSHRDEVHTETE